MRRAGPSQRGQAKVGLVLLHGRGASAADILGLLEQAALPDVAALAPEAPGRSWWPTSFLAPSVQIEPYVRFGVEAVRAAVVTLEDEGLSRGRIWLGGFSQGACLALEAFAREGQGLAGVLAFSGGLVGTADAEGDPDPALYGSRPKLFQYGHHPESPRARVSVHEQDPHIPLRRAQDSAAVLRRLGAEVTLKVYPGAGHGIMRDDLSALRTALNTQQAAS
jgi:predicted esterase